jgi:hypothetical protein
MSRPTREEPPGYRRCRPGARDNAGFHRKRRMVPPWLARHRSSRAAAQRVALTRGECSGRPGARKPRARHLSPEARFGASSVACAFLASVLPPLPRCSGWAYSSLMSPCRIRIPRRGCRVDLHIDLFKSLLGVHSRCGPRTRVTLFATRYSEDFSHFVTSMTASVASGWSGRGGTYTTGKRRFRAAHTQRSLRDSAKRLLRR